MFPVMTKHYTRNHVYLAVSRGSSQSRSFKSHGKNQIIDFNTNDLAWLPGKSKCSQSQMLQVQEGSETENKGENEKKKKKNSMMKLFYVVGENKEKKFYHHMDSQTVWTLKKVLECYLL